MNIHIDGPFYNTVMIAQVYLNTMLVLNLSVRSSNVNEFFILLITISPNQSVELMKISNHESLADTSNKTYVCIIGHIGHP